MQAILDNPRLSRYGRSCEPTSRQSHLNSHEHVCEWHWLELKQPAPLALSTQVLRC